jgi:predicted nucleic acid-binding protein
MQDAVIDACCLIDLLASGDAEVILRSSGFAWHLPSAVQSEVKYCRQHDPVQPGKFTVVTADLSGLISSGLLTVCHPANQQELDQFIHYAAMFRSDGEAMCLALAEQRHWFVATDDRRAIRVAQQAGLPVISCPELVKAWADATGPNQAVLNRVLQNIQSLAQFRPNATMPEHQWWLDQLAKTVP